MSKNILSQGKILRGVLGLTIFLLGILAGWSFGVSPEKNDLKLAENVVEKSDLSQDNSNSDDNAHPVRQGGYKFINPLLECEVGMEKINNLVSLRKQMTDFVKEETNKQEILGMSVYFRDLNNGPSFGINEKENFYPASLLKVPILMAYFKEAEKNPQLLEEKIVYDKRAAGDDMPQNFKPAEKLVFGQSYTVGDLLRRMIIFSDNETLGLLSSKISDQAMDRTYHDLGLSLPNVRTPDDFMSVKDYASFFRILFNASYLSRDYSEKALEILSASDFKDGIAAGVDQGVIVSHKFGEREILVGGRQTNQLHDCGIVYNRDNPYLICVMTRGSDFKKMAEVIKNVSRMIFKEIKNK